MRLNDYKNDFYEFSGKASDNTRTAALGGIAIIWVFRITTETVPQIPRELVLPLISFGASLGCDLLHYSVAAMIWGIFHRINETRLRKPTENPLLSHPIWMPMPITVLFVLKIAFVLLGYITLIIYLWPFLFKSLTSTQ